MAFMSDFYKEAYELQVEAHRNAREEQFKDLLSVWLDDSTCDNWRHNRMYEFANLFANDGDSSWLTVGDGRFGLDCVSLKRRGIKSVLPSDIAESGLKKAKEIGIIENYAVENAEKLSFEDGQFDYVFCKESYHHFPRPFAALYEMIRVAKKGVILVEPNDYWQSVVGRAVYGFQQLFGKVRHIDQNRYEDSGNYVYSLSEREIEKVCLGLDLPHLFIKGQNNVYITGGEHVQAKWGSLKFLRMRLTVMLLDCLCYMRIFKPTLLSVFVSKQQPSDLLRRSLLEAGWKEVYLPRNPHRKLETF
jgi:SAM-dependent methyltransferase